MNECFLGIDIGTGSSKGTIVGIEGTVLAQAAIQHDMNSPAPGRYEQDADSIWWKDLVYLTHTLIKTLRGPSWSIDSIKGMSVSTIAPCVLPVDNRGTPLRPGIMYGIDTRATEQITEIETEIGKNAIFNMTGQNLSSQSCCPKILWIKQHEPDVWGKTYKFLTATGYLVFRLTGSYTVDMYDAIGYAPLFNIRTRRWDNTYADSLFDLSKLPDITWATDCAGTLEHSVSVELGLPSGIPVMTGTADAAAEAVASGVSHVGDMMMMYGSSNFFILKTKVLRPVSNFWAAHFLEPNTTVLTGGMATVGSLFKWIDDTFPGRTFKEWEILASLSEPGAKGVTVLPYFAGERTPFFAPKAKGGIFGLTLHTSAGDIYRAIQEAVGYGIRHNIEELNRVGEEARRIVAIGGVTNSSRMMQYVSDITGCTQLLPKQRLGACYGDAFLAAVGSGYIASLNTIDEWVEIEREFIPNQAVRSIYDESYSRYRDLYESTKHLL